MGPAAAARGSSFPHTRHHFTPGKPLTSGYESLMLWGPHALKIHQNTLLGSMGGSQVQVTIESRSIVKLESCKRSSHVCEEYAGVDHRAALLLSGHLWLLGVVLVWEGCD